MTGQDCESCLGTVVVQSKLGLATALSLDLVSPSLQRHARKKPRCYPVTTQDLCRPKPDAVRYLVGRCTIHLWIQKAKGGGGKEKEKEYRRHPRCTGNASNTGKEDKKGKYKTGNETSSSPYDLPPFHVDLQDAQVLTYEKIRVQPMIISNPSSL